MYVCAELYVNIRGIHTRTAMFINHINELKVVYIQQ